ncbi:MAG: dTMP kinase [Thermoplasmata archaeon]
MFIAVEGIDGSGKTTLCSGLKHELESRGFRVFLTKEPTDDPSNYTGDDVLLFLLFTIDRYKHQRMIEEKLKEGYIVISDRYISSSYSYQMAGIENFFGGEKEAIMWMDAVSSVIVVRPDIEILIDIDVETAMERIASRSGRDSFENIRTVKMARDNYLKMKNNIILDGRLGKSDLLKRATDIVLNRLKK